MRDYEGLRHAEGHPAHHRRDQPRALGDGHSHQHHQHQPQGLEVGEVLHHVQHEPVEPLLGDQRARLDELLAVDEREAIAPGLPQDREPLRGDLEGPELRTIDPLLVDESLVRVQLHVDIAQAGASRRVLQVDREALEARIDREGPPLDPPAALAGLEDLRRRTEGAHASAGQDGGEGRHREEQQAEEPERVGQLVPQPLDAGQKAKYAGRALHVRRPPRLLAFTCLAGPQPTSSRGASILVQTSATRGRRQLTGTEPGRSVSSVAAENAEVDTVTKTPYDGLGGAAAAHTREHERSREDS